MHDQFNGSLAFVGSKVMEIAKDYNVEITVVVTDRDKVRTHADSTGDSATTAIAIAALVMRLQSTGVHSVDSVFDMVRNILTRVDRPSR